MSIAIAAIVFHPVGKAPQRGGRALTAPAGTVTGMTIQQ
ncbi:hypothetical protein [Azospirillum melinis]